ncbi:gamma-soluble NSF attachment protein-like isoform X3 [Diaphorina citri]|uniref:Gamma-soluble NSF attachment protein n=1 Tax=Diaphorina citri TaxID=121845 RepID=A0A1S4EGW3_DIACI|nr:gamma-soluble NSF attachment protein-like isoform X1 [Diaphorina citri]XP_026682725.1 gamma-soluble NSF attachment protein-like isoform X2 [Diaphorina citri]XP_026682726.1 gamma-soluble NSF attachment protein-like isoform X3 [Diaphorina citri]
MTSDRKKEEGMEYVKSAEKHLKTSLLKWKPDYDSAADDYSKAATCFKGAKSFQQCKEYLLKAANCYETNKSAYHAAKHLEQAIMMCKELNDLTDVENLAKQAATLFLEQGNREAASTVLEKGAKSLEELKSDAALTLYSRAADVAHGEDNYKQAAEYISRAARMCVRVKEFDKAADLIRQEIGYHQESEHLLAIGRLAVALVLVQLARGDTVAAEKAFKEWGNCCEAPEVQTLEKLLQAFDEEDPEGARQALNDPFIKHMDVEYSRLARDLPLPSATCATPRPASIRQNAAPSYVSPRDAEQGGSSSTKAAISEDEFEGGLC